MGGLVVWIASASASGCVVTTGPDVVPGVPSLHARCTWPDASLEAVRAHLAAVDEHNRFVWSIAEDHVVETQSGRTLVHQRHVVPGARPREVQVWAWLEELEHGGLRVAWLADQRDFELSPGAVRADRAEGEWRVRQRPAGGVEVELDLVYAPGGAVPAFVVRWAQSWGAARVLSDLRSLSTPTPRSL